MRGAGGCGRGASQLATAKRRLLQAASVGGLTLTGGLVLPDVATGQVAVTLPEVTVTAPRPPPIRRATRQSDGHSADAARRGFLTRLFA